MSITDDSNESKTNPSCSMPPVLIKATYTDYFNISLLTVCLIFLEEIQHRATCVPPFSLVTLLAYTLNTIWKCPIWRHMHSSEFCLYAAYIVMYILHCNHDLTENYLFYQFRKVPFAAGVDSRQGHSLLRTANLSYLGLNNLLRPFPANFWT